MIASPMPLSESSSTLGAAAGTTRAIPGPSSSTPISIASSVISKRRERLPSCRRARGARRCRRPRSRPASGRPASSSSIGVSRAMPARASRARMRYSVLAGIDSVTTSGLTTAPPRHRLLEPARASGGVPAAADGETCICEMPICARRSPTASAPRRTAARRSGAPARRAPGQPRLDEHAVLDLVEARCPRCRGCPASSLRRRRGRAAATASASSTPRRSAAPRRPRPPSAPVASASSAIVGAPAQFRGLGLDRAREPDAELLHPAGHVERPRAVAEVALDLADDRRNGVGRELHVAARVEALDRRAAGRSTPTWTRSSCGSPRPA